MMADRHIQITRFRRFSTLAAALFLVFIPAGWGCGGGEESERWNLVLITVDALRADRLGCYGYQRACTPNIDGFAEGALRYEQAFTVSNATLPSHATMLTGRYPHGHGVPRNGSPLPADVSVLAELLRDRGYATAAVVSADALASTMGLARGFEAYDEALETAGTNPGERRAEHTTDAAIDRLEGYGEAEPFFLWVHFAGPRFPDQSPPPCDTIHGDGCRGPADGRMADRDALQGPGPGPSVEDLQRMVDIYDGEVADLDHWLGRLLEALERPGFRERTLVVITASRGESPTGDEKRFSHGRALRQASVGVPLIIRYPEALLVPPGTVVRTVQTLDIFPTLLAAGGAAAPPGSEGTVLIPPPGCQEPAVGPEGYRPAFAEASLPMETGPPDSIEWPNVGKAEMVVRYPWKLVRTSHGDQVELFDLERDPLEQENVAARHPGTVDELRLLLRDWRTDARGTE